MALRLSPAQEKALQDIDMGDIESEKMVMFQKKQVVSVFMQINHFRFNFREVKCYSNEDEEI